MILEKAVTMFLRSVEQIQYGSVNLEFPDGRKYNFTGQHSGPHAHLKLNDIAVLLRLVRGGDIAFAEDYRDGHWDSEDIASLVQCAILNSDYIHNFISGSKIRQILARVSYIFTRNSKQGSKRNIHAHYDIGNDFYQLWLDKSMTYSSALFRNDSEDLTQGQNNKYDRILDRVGSSNHHILEIGCGWGGFAERGVEQNNHHITAVTLSESQQAFAVQRLQDKKGQVDIRLQDYRDISGKFDSIVSIEMFEAVGEKYWHSYFSKIQSVLMQKGKALVQTIVIDDAQFDQYRRSGDAIRSYIFPGGMLPSPSIFAAEAEKAGLRITDKFNFGQDYARTLNAWLMKFNAQSEAIKALGYDESFMRLWRFYLAFCSGAFLAKRIDVMQIELQHQN